MNRTTQPAWSALLGKLDVNRSLEEKKTILVIMTTLHLHAVHSHIPFVNLVAETTNSEEREAIERFMTQYKIDVS
jgi:hypothetical protein